MKFRNTKQASKRSKGSLLSIQVGESLTQQLGSPGVLFEHSRGCCLYGASAGHEGYPAFTARVMHPARISSCESSSSREKSLSSDSTQFDLAIYDCHPRNPSSMRSEVSIPRDAFTHAPWRQNRKLNRKIPAFDDPESCQVIERLAAQYGQAAHMGLLDRNYLFFINRERTGALTYKLQDGVAIVSGHPLCAPNQFTDIMDQFDTFRKSFHMGAIFMGAGDEFAAYARARRWPTMKFGVERVVNPMENDLLNECTGKRLITQNKHLLSSTKGGITLGVYIPGQQAQPFLETELQEVYDQWRTQHKKTDTTLEPFVTVFHLLDFPNLMAFVYSRGPDGAVNGLAALRYIGAKQGYHIDPCIPAPGAPKGISDLLIFAAMSFMKQLNVSYLSLGYEPLQKLGDVYCLSPLPQMIARAIYDNSLKRLPVAGKKAYHDKFRTDPALESSIYMIFPSGLPGLRQLLALAHIANIRVRNLASAGWKSKNTKE